jgi:hypothetical protein
LQNDDSAVLQVPPKSQACAMNIERAAILASVLKSEVEQVKEHGGDRKSKEVSNQVDNVNLKQTKGGNAPTYALRRSRFDEALIRAAIARGDNTYQLAEAWQTDYNTIRKFCIRRGIERNRMPKGVRPALNAEQVAEAVRMVKRGIPTREIAAKFGIQNRSLRRYYLKGIVIDGRKERYRKPHRNRLLSR